jgi:hypothetical protein
MRFQPGQSGNPGGRKKSIGLSRAVRASEGLKTWARLIRIRDDLVLERKIIKGAEGEPVEVDVVPSAKVYADVCCKILAYCWGLPVQQLNLGDTDGHPLSMKLVVSEGNNQNTNGTESGSKADGISIRFGGSNGQGA